MSDYIETMMSVYEVPWHGKGEILKGFPKSSLEALKAAGLNWEVIELKIVALLAERAGFEPAKEVSPQQQLFSGIIKKKQSILAWNSGREGGIRTREGGFPPATIILRNN